MHVSLLSTGFVVRSSDRLRFGRPALSEEDGEYDDAADGHELALPVLERLELKGGRPHEFHGAHRMLPMCHLVGAVFSGTSKGMQHGREHEEGPRAIANEFS
jgi:hypothetical protein